MAVDRGRGPLTVQIAPVAANAATGIGAHAASTLRRRVGLRRWLAAALWRAWQRFRMDERTAYLSRAESAVDLEVRIRRWNERDRRGEMPLP
jgi:hypothetical protein